MTGVLLDTNALIYLAGGAPITAGADAVVARAQKARAAYVSPFLAWELGVIATKVTGTPDFGGLPAGRWFTRAIRKLKLRLAPMTLHIAATAAEVPVVIRHKDPADCVFVATARVRGLTLITRDRTLLRVSATRPGYFQALAC